MTHKLIKTDNYLLVFDDSKARVEYYLHGIDDIIAHLPLNGSPIFEGVDLLPPLEDDEVEKDAEFHVSELDWDTDDFEKNCGRMSFKAGYNKARERYKYTEEDVRKAVNEARQLEDWQDLVWEYEYEEIIQSLQQPKYPIAFECEMEQVFYPANMPKEGEDRPPYRIKTTTNSQGQTVWVGKYK